MLAVYGFVFEKNPAPSELSIGLDWLRFGTPYRAGGLHDQPKLLMRRMKIALSVYNAAQAWKYKYTPTSESEKHWYFIHDIDVKILQTIWNWTSNV